MNFLIRAIAKSISRGGTKSAFMRFMFPAMRAASRKTLLNWFSSRFRVNNS
jgi:hypothetical protein